MVFRVQQPAKPIEHVDAALQLAGTFREGQPDVRPDFGEGTDALQVGMCGFHKCGECT